MFEMRMLRVETPAGLSAAGKRWTSASPGSFHIGVYPTPCTRNGPDVASWHKADVARDDSHFVSLKVRLLRQPSLITLQDNCPLEGDIMDLHAKTVDDLTQALKRLPANTRGRLSFDDYESITAEEFDEFST